MVTHNIPQANRLADKIVVLHDGESMPIDDPFAVSLLRGEYIDQG